MKKRHTLGFSLALLLGLCTSALAQAPTPPPRYIQIYREDVKPGRVAGHEKYEAGWPRAFAKANWPTPYVAFTSITGPLEAWFVATYDSFDAWEKDQKAMTANATLTAESDRLSAGDAEFISGYRSFVARYRQDLSHRPGVEMPKQRYLSITIVRVRPGHNPDYEEYRKIIKAAHEKADVKDNHSVYQVLTGLPNTTFLVVTPMRSLKELDDYEQMHSQAYQDAVGDDGRAKMRELASAGFVGSDTHIYAFSPGMSYPPKAYVTADPEFWAPKPKPAPAAKSETKPPAKQ